MTVARGCPDRAEYIDHLERKLEEQSTARIAVTVHEEQLKALNDRMAVLENNSVAVAKLCRPHQQIMKRMEDNVSRKVHEMQQHVHLINNLMLGKQADVRYCGDLSLIHI